MTDDLQNELNNICPECGETVLIEDGQGTSLICANCGFLISEDSWST